MWHDANGDRHQHASRDEKPQGGVGERRDLSVRSLGDDECAPRYMIMSTTTLASAEVRREIMASGLGGGCYGENQRRATDPCDTSVQSVVVRRLANVCFRGGFA